MNFKIKKKYFLLLATMTLCKFSIIKFVFGFKAANNYLKRANKYSIEIILRCYGAKIGTNCDIETGLTFHYCKDYSNLTIGNGCHIGKNCFFDLRDKITIKDNSTIAMNSTFITHQDPGKSYLVLVYKKCQFPIIIADNVYIGASSTILMGVTLGQGSIVAAGSLVNKCVEKNTIVGGVPAKFIKEIKK